MCRQSAGPSFLFADAKQLSQLRHCIGRVGFQSDQFYVGCL